MKIDKNDLWFPNGLMNWDNRFNVQHSLEYKKCWLATEYYGNNRCSYWIEFYCRKYNINQRAVLVRMEYEQSLFHGVVKGKEYLLPDGKTKSLLKTKNMICGVSGGSVRASRKYRGFRLQVEMCCKILRREMKEYKRGVECVVYVGKKRKAMTVKPATASAYALFVYSPYPCAVKKIKAIWAREYSEDFK